MTQTSLRRAFDPFLPVRSLDRAALDEAAEVLNFLGLEQIRDRTAAHLPYGLQRRVEIARALALRPKLLLLDEPVAGMNADEAGALRDVLIQLRTTGLGIVVIEHDMRFIMGVCDYLHVLDFGSKIAQGPPAAMRADPAVLRAYLGEDGAVHA